MVAAWELFWRPILNDTTAFLARATRGDLTDEDVLQAIEALRAAYEDETQWLAEHYPAAFRAARRALRAMEKGADDATATRMLSPALTRWRRVAARDVFLEHFLWWSYLRRGMRVSPRAMAYALRRGGPWHHVVGRVLAAHSQQMPNLPLQMAQLAQSPQTRDRLALSLGGLAVAGIADYGDLQRALRALGPVPDAPTGGMQSEDEILRTFASTAAWDVKDEAQTWERLGPEAANWIKREGRRERRESAAPPSTEDGDEIRDEWLDESAPDILDDILDDECATELLSLLKSPIDREIARRDADGETPDEIAAALGITRNAVYLRQGRMPDRAKKPVDK